MNYKIGDFIIRLKNASLAKRHDVVVSYSKLNKSIANVLLKAGFVSDIKEENNDGKKVLIVTLRYEDRMPVLSDVEIFSKPSLRVYQRAKNVKETRKKSMGIDVMSTSKGVMSANDAKKKGIGGELLFKVW